MHPKTSQQLLRFCQQVVAGMEYLSRKEFVHRDLAARNVLVTDDKICKVWLLGMQNNWQYMYVQSFQVSDFGMSRSITSTDYYISKGGRIPVKWTAPEVRHYYMQFLCNRHNEFVILPGSALQEALHC
jgi:ephrin-B